MAHHEISVEMIWKAAGKVLTIDEFIENQRQNMNSVEIAQLRARSSRLMDKLKGTTARDYPGLAEGIRLTVQVLDSPTARRTRDPLPNWLAEIGSAAAYVMNCFDLIPDRFSGIGLSDDAFLLRRVIERNKKELLKCISECIEHAIGNKR
jgi:uncharacterized membrane protein YkvA (DUF1232 family)